MIYTCTLNPALDKEIHADDFQHENQCSFRHVKQIAGGKGINVSRGLKALGIHSINIGFLGGTNGKTIKELLDSEKIEYDFIEIKENTRANTKLRLNDQWSEISGVSPIVGEDEFAQLLDKIDQMNSDDILVLSGSLPSGNFDYDIKICERAFQNNIPFILDVSGVRYNKLLSYKPLLVKPNKKELEEAVGYKMSSLNDLIQAGKKILNKGAKSVLISLDDQGAILMDEFHAWKAKPLRGMLRRPYGAGDHMVSGYLFGYMNQKSNEELLKYGIGAASLHIFKDEYTDYDLNEMIQIIEIEEIHE